MQATQTNIDEAERAKFDALADEWWDPDGSLRTLHHINPVRLQYIEQTINLTHKRVLDVGCGGGLLAEALTKKQAFVTGLDISTSAIAVAESHKRTAGLDIDYVTVSAEEYAVHNQHEFDVVTCMELLEHVPDINSLLQACGVMLKPGGHLFLATINRTAKSYVSAIIAAEYLLQLLPRGTHDYARFIKPSELHQVLRQQRFMLVDIAGMTYLPGLNKCAITGDPAVNYIAHAVLGD
ncbi:MAG: Ubiquinone biosynthesis O-methyltransferase [Gammaproteobacteria bacterium]|nr:Ubiquinone biosynthesis O-methyltransferase [Gammaproteobacteria bacterium]